MELDDFYSEIENVLLDDVVKWFATEEYQILHTLLKDLSTGGN